MPFHHHHHTDNNNISDETSSSYLKLLSGNIQYVQDKLLIDKSYFSKLAHGQAPKTLLIGCSDSRIQPDQLTQSEPGSLFIHRNVANLIVNTDMNFMSVLQYAVEVLKVQHIIVLGHYGCGGVKAAMSNQPHGLIDKWLRNIKDIIRLHQNELSIISNAEDRFDRLIELNVEEQAFNIFKTSIIQNSWASGHEVKIHGWVYAINTGLIKDLHIEQSKIWEEIERLYEFNFTGNASDVTYHPQEDTFCSNEHSPRLPVETLDVRLSRVNSYDPNSKDLDNNSQYVKQFSDLAEEEIIAQVTETLKHPLRRMRKSYARISAENGNVELPETEIDE